ADRHSRILVEAFLLEISVRRRRDLPGRGVALIFSSSAPPPPGIVRRQILSLRPLKPQDARRLLELLSLPITIPPDFLTRVGTQARGLPLRLRQIARAIREEWGAA